MSMWGFCEIVSVAYARICICIFMVCDWYDFYYVTIVSKSIFPLYDCQSVCQLVYSSMHIINVHQRNLSHKNRIACVHMYISVSWDLFAELNYLFASHPSPQNPGLVFSRWINHIRDVINLRPWSEGNF